MAPNRPRRRPITADDLSAYGPVVSGKVDVDAAARGLKTSKTKVRQGLKAANDKRSTMFLRQVSGRTEADLSADASAKGMLQAAYGRGPRGGVVNSKDAAEALGVSQVTVRRWASGKQKPSPEHLDALKKAARKASTTKRGRKAATDEFRASKRGQQALRQGDKLWISGNQGYLGFDNDYAQDRRIQVDISGDDIGAMLQAYEDGGDSGMLEWLTDNPGQKYLEGWDFITIDGIGFGKP